jgi:hypothetical protein
VRNFTDREDKLLKQAMEASLEIPVRLQNWRHWIGNSQIYLNELRNYVEIMTMKRNPAVSAVMQREKERK